MPEPSDVNNVIHEWIIKADNDLTAAVCILKLGNQCPTETVCFHCQQCVEKYLKSLLVMRGIPVTKTHDIRVLMSMVPKELRPDLSEDLQDEFTKYAVVIRYPEAGVDISLAKARKAVAITRRVRREVRRLLPRGALRRRTR